MRADKLTSKFQEALSDAQTIALGNDHAYIEPSHVLLAMLRQTDGPVALLQRAGVQVNKLNEACDALVKRLPQVQGQEQVQVGRELVGLLQAAEKEAIKRGDQYVASELFFLALADSKDKAGELAREYGLSRASLDKAIEQVRGGQRVDNPDAETQREALKKYTLFRRSSKSPRNLAPANSPAMSNDNTRLSLSVSGTSPATMRWASPSTMAVLPTPGSPINTGLFLVRRCNTWIARRISSSRPMTGSNLP